MSDNSVATLTRPSGRRGASSWRPRRPELWIGGFLTGGVFLVALFGWVVAPHGATQIVGPPYAPPSSSYPFGLDYLGRDALSRFLIGGRTTVLLALAATVFASVSGGALGVLAAYAGGFTDSVISRVIEVFLALPGLLLSLLLITALGTGMSVVVLAVTVVSAPRVARIARGRALEICNLDYVQVARARGERASYVMSREMLPRVLPPLVVDFGVRVSASIILVAGLSFLGLGVQQPTADWGLMISENRQALTFRPLTVVPPVIAIALLTIGINTLIDARKERGR